MEKLATNVRRFLFAFTLFIIMLLILLISSCVEFEWWKISFTNSNGFNATVSLGLWKACYKETSAPEVCENYGSEDQLRYRITDLKTIRVFTIIPPAALAACFITVILMSLSVCKIRVQLYLIGTAAFFTLLSGLFDMLLPEAATGDVLWQKVFLKISQNSLEKTCVGVSFLNEEVILCIVIGLSAFSNASPSKPDWVMIPTSFIKTKEEYAIGFIVTCICLILTFVAVLIMLALYLYVIRHSREYVHKKKEIQVEGAVRQYTSNKNFDVYRETDSEQSYEKKIKKSEKRIPKKSTWETSLYNSPQYYYTNEYQHDDSYQQETIPRRPYTNLTYNHDASFDYDNQNDNLPTNGNYILPPSKDQSIYYEEKEIPSTAIYGKLSVGENPERVIKTYQSNTINYCNECGATNNTSPVNEELKTIVSLKPGQKQPQQAAAHRDERAMEEDALRSSGYPKFFYQEHPTYEPQNQATRKIQTELTTYPDRPRALRHGQRQMSQSIDYWTLSINKSPEMKRKSFYEGNIMTNGYCDECGGFFSNDKVEGVSPYTRSLSRKTKHSQSVSGVWKSSGDHPPVRVLNRLSTSNAPHTSRHHPAALY